MTGTPLRVVLLTDGKPGHRSQLEGLVDALARRTSVDATWRTVRAFGVVDGPRVKADVAIAAGRRTHLGLLRLARQGTHKSVVLMRPSVPGRWFDLAIVPSHDGVPESDHIWNTTGVLNNVAPPSGETPRSGGVVLIGGPSKHHRWDDDRVFADLTDLLSQDATAWTLTTSRRTPERTIEKLVMRFADEPRVTVVPHTETPAGWLPQTLASASDAVVTEDSVSMLSEAITAGCRTTVLSLPRPRETRVTRYVDALLAEGHACPLTARDTFVPPEPLAEADRIAGRLLDRWWPDAVAHAA